MNTYSEPNKRSKAIKRFILAISILLFVWTLKTTSAASKPNPVETVDAVPFYNVNVGDGFWGDILTTHRDTTIRHCFDQCEKTGRIQNFAVAAGLKKGKHQGAQYNDSDVYKIVQGTIYNLKCHPNTKLESYLNGVLAKILLAQEDNGYLFTLFTIKNPDQRFKHISPGPKHELYCMGHFIEAAVAHYRMTGQEAMLAAAEKLAAHVDSVFGDDQLNMVPHHEEIELALVKLYRVTRNRKYLDLAQYFIDNRGHHENRPTVGLYGQDHLPVRQQSEIVGHAVRAMYNCIGMVALYEETNDDELLDAANRLWESATWRKLYITGGIGSIGRGESFGNAYQLPNETAYAETCAGIGLVFFAHDMWRISPRAEYMDVLERALYNEVLGGVSINGDEFFYNNKLLSRGKGWGSVRQKWYRCACCPSNIARFIPKVPGYIYGRRARNLFVNLFIPGTSKIETGFGKIKLSQETNYPWEGSVKITVEPAKSAEFTLNVRIPGWARNVRTPGNLYRYADQTKKPQVNLRVNGENLDLKPIMKDGYASIKRTWSAGDVVELNLPMPVRRVLANEKVVADEGCVALHRGPIVYCAEWPENGDDLFGIVLDDDVVMKAEHRKDLLNGVTVLTGTLKSGREFTAVPFYARANRGQGPWNVWIARTQAAANRLTTKPFPHDWQAWGDLKASHVYPPSILKALQDKKVPKSSGEADMPYFTWLNHVGTSEWVQKKFAEPTSVSSVAVYWFEKDGELPCRPPKSWRVLYKKDDQWKKVENKTPYGVKGDTFNKVNFKKVKTTAIRVEANLRESASAGILELRID